MRHPPKMAMVRSALNCWTDRAERETRRASAAHWLARGRLDIEIHRRLLPLPTKNSCSLRPGGGVGHAAGHLPARPGHGHSLAGQLFIGLLDAAGVRGIEPLLVQLTAKKAAAVAASKPCTRARHRLMPTWAPRCGCPPSLYAVAPGRGVGLLAHLHLRDGRLLLQQW